MHEHNPSAPLTERLINRRSLARAGLEILSIIVGVLAALAVSEWQEDRSNEERTQAALLNVRTELEKNLALLTTVHENNVRIIELLRADPAATDQDGQFVPAVQVADSAWRSLSAAGLAGYVEFDLVHTLSEVYALMDVYRRTAYSLIDANLAILATATATERNMENIDGANLFARNFTSYFQLIVNVESALIQAHKNGIAELASRE